MIIVSVKVMGSGDYLSRNAGNLDVINCAAIEVVKSMVKLKKDQSTPAYNQYEHVLDI